jgi:hypothetical protein
MISSLAATLATAPSTERFRYTMGVLPAGTRHGGTSSRRSHRAALIRACRGAEVALPRFASSAGATQAPRGAGTGTTRAHR